MPVITRITCFRVPNDADIPAVLESYKVLEANARKDNKPYILHVSAAATLSHPRSEGYKVIGTTKFASVADMEYYDRECEAHKQMKAGNSDKAEVPPLVLVVEG